MQKPDEFVEAMALRIHRRNGGQLARLDPGLPVLAPELHLDSLDLAEIMVAVEKEYGVSPFEAPKPPRTWADIIAALQEVSTPGGAARP